MRKVLKNILSHGIVFVVSGIIFTIVGVYAATTFSSAQVTYTANSQTTVEGALNDLYTKANNMVPMVPIVPIDPNTFNTNTAKTVYASSKGVCIKRNNKLNCFKINNWAEEQTHIQQVFSDISCTVSSSDVSCSAIDFYCRVYSNGYVYCLDQSDDSRCYVFPDGSVNCD